MSDNLPVIPNGNSKGELNVDDLALDAAACSGTCGRLENGIDLNALICHIKVPTSPPQRILPRSRVPTHGDSCQSNLSLDEAVCKSLSTLGNHSQFLSTQRARPSITLRLPPVKLALHSTRILS